MNIDKQLLKETLIKLTKYPTMYIGKNRFDYIQHFYQGWHMFHSALIYNWMSSYDIQKWLFLKESVSIQTTSLNGWILMQRCYGNRQEAIDQFREMVEQIDLSNGDEYHVADTVAWHIYQIYSVCKWNRDRTDWAKSIGFMYNSEASAYYYPLNDRIKSIIGVIEHTYDSILPLVARMINEPFSELWLYLHYERYFLCARFLYRSTGGAWNESTVLSCQADYYNDLVILHAYAALVREEQHSNHIITLHYNNGTIAIDSVKTTDDWCDIFNNDADVSVCNINPFSKSYLEWKKSKIE